MTTTWSVSLTPRLVDQKVGVGLISNAYGPRGEYRGSKLEGITWVGYDQVAGTVQRYLYDVMVLLNGHDSVQATLPE